MKKYMMCLIIFFAAAACAGCYSRPTVTAGLSPQLKEYYAIYPSIEMDIAAVTADEADEIREQSVENYFAVGNPVRKGLMPHTLTFSSEQTEPQTMKRSAGEWETWLEKKPEKLAVVANLPRKTEKTPAQKDSRIVIVDLKTAFLWPDTLYFEVKPGSVIQIYSAPQDPEYEIKKLRAEREELERKKQAQAKNRK